MAESEFLQLQNECPDPRLPHLGGSNEIRYVKVLDKTVMCNMGVQFIRSVMMEGTPDQLVLLCSPVIRSH